MSYLKSLIGGVKKEKKIVDRRFQFKLMYPKKGMMGAKKGIFDIFFQMVGKIRKYDKK